MKLVVVTGLRWPADQNEKSRPAVVLGMVDGRLAIAPCSTWPARHGLTVPPGAVLVQKSSPAYAATHFACEATAIRIGDTALFAVGSVWVRDLRQIGTLDLALDKRLRDNLVQAMKEFDLLRHPNVAT